MPRICRFSPKHLYSGQPGAKNLVGWSGKKDKISMPEAQNYFSKEFSKNKTIFPSLMDVFRFLIKIQKVTISPEVGFS